MARTNIDDADKFLVNNPEDVNPLAQMKDHEQLTEDNDTPFDEPRVQRDHIPSGHQAADSNIDSDQLYQEGLAAAAGVDTPEPRDAIGKYHPDENDTKPADE